jgi:uncharacterized repeat protein (TIGR01451 family)
MDRNCFTSAIILSHSLVRARERLADGKKATPLQMNLKSPLVYSTFCALLACFSAFGAPVITDFSPIAGSAGDQIQITGSGFTGAGISVRFFNGQSGVVAPIVFVNSDTIMTVAVPSGITTGPISILQGASKSTTANDFLAVGTGPFITSFSPAYGVVNDTVTIDGVHFAGVTSVSFHGTGTTFNANSAGTQISTRVPVGATSGVLTVSTSHGTSNSPSAFTVIGPGPFISGFSPVSGDVGITIQITGLHFTGATNVTIAGRSAPIVTATSDTLLQIKAPSGLVSGPIGVFTPLGTYVTSSNFFGKPTITAVSPISGRAGTNVSISGKNLLGTSTVSFNGVVAPGFSVVNNSNIIVSVPAGATTGLLRIIIPDASAFSPTNFIVRPTFSSFSPNAGPVGTAVTIQGANLNAGGVSVSFNGVKAATPTGVSFGQLTAIVPPGTTTGPISLSTVDGADTNVALFYLPARIKSLSSTNAAPGARIVITGTNFLGASLVSFNGTPAVSFIVSNNVSMSAVVPSGLVTGPISITTPAGLAVSAGTFYGAPVISSFSPTHGLPGDSVTVKGVNFLGGKVLFGQLAASVSSLNNTQLVATVPAGAQNGSITVYGPAGTNTTLANFILDYTSDLQVGLTNSQSTVFVGSNLVYTVSIFNGGPFLAPNTFVTNVLPTSVSLRSVSLNTPGILTTNGNTIVASLGTFALGSAVSLTLTVTPNVPGVITDVAAITSDNPDPSPLNNLATINTLVQPLPLLSAGRFGSQFKLSWPVGLTNYSLYSSITLSAGGSWSIVTVPPTISGGFNTVIITNTAAARFFRLKR